MNLLLKLRIVFSKRNLLLANAILCLCYALCYTFLIVLPFAYAAQNGKFHTDGVVLLNLIFLAVISLNLNTFAVVYSELAKPRKKYIRIVYIVSVVIWILYILVSYYFTIFVPGFVTHFFHYIRATFRMIGFPMNIPCIAFIIGLSLLCKEYYYQQKLKHIFYFIIPVIILFAFKSALPHLLNIMAWVTFSGFQLLLYFSIFETSLHKNKQGAFLPENEIDFLFPGKSNLAH